MKLKKTISILIAILIIYILAIKIAKTYIYPYKHKQIINKYSEEYDLDPYLVLAIIKTESNFEKKAVSKKSAKGLMQIMDSTGEWAAKEIGINYFLPDMLYDEELNIRIGTWYLNNLKEEFSDLDLIIAAYNGGSGNVNKWLGDDAYSIDGESLSYIPFPETKKYVDRVKLNYNIYKYLYNK